MNRFQAGKIKQVFSRKPVFLCRNSCVENNAGRFCGGGGGGGGEGARKSRENGKIESSGRVKFCALPHIILLFIIYPADLINIYN